MASMCLACPGSALGSLVVVASLPSAFIAIIGHRQTLSPEATFAFDAAVLATPSLSLPSFVHTHTSCVCLCTCVCEKAWHVYAVPGRLWFPLI